MISAEDADNRWAEEGRSCLSPRGQVEPFEMYLDRVRKRVAADPIHQCVLADLARQFPYFAKEY